MGKMLIKQLPIEERPRERLLKYGVSNLSNQDLLTILFRNGTKGFSAFNLAGELLNNIKSFNNLKFVNKQDLLKINGVGGAKTVEILASIELGRRLFTGVSNDICEKYCNSSDVYRKNRYLFLNKKQEYFYCLYLNSKKELIERKLLFMGTLNKSLVHPREVFKEAYLLSASSIICMHNHPSGDITPSNDDIILTKSLMEIGRLQQIPVVDHLIFSDDNYFSFYEDCDLKYEKNI